MKFAPPAKFKIASQTAPSTVCAVPMWRSKAGAVQVRPPKDYMHVTESKDLAFGSCHLQENSPLDPFAPFSSFPFVIQPVH